MSYSRGFCPFGGYSAILISYSKVFYLFLWSIQARRSSVGLDHSLPLLLLLRLVSNQELFSNQSYADCKQNDYALFVLLRRQKIARGFASDRAIFSRLRNTNSLYTSPHAQRGWFLSTEGSYSEVLSLQLQNAASLR